MLQGREKSGKMGEADCHSRCAHWLHNDRIFAWGAV